MKIGIYPGSFDGVTYGHLAIMERACKLVDHLYVSIGVNRSKKSSAMFSSDQRIAHLNYMVHGNAVYHSIITGSAELRSKVIFNSYGGLLINHAREVGAGCIFRGLRPISDFDNEFLLFGVNHAVDPSIETVLLFAPPEHQFISSTVVKELAINGAFIESMAPKFVFEEIRLATKS